MEFKLFLILIYLLFSTTNIIKTFGLLLIAFINCSHWFHTTLMVKSINIYYTTGTYRLVHGTYFSVPSHAMAIYACPIPSIPRDSHYNINMEYSSIKIIKFMKVTKIKQEIDYDVTAANAHQS